MPGALAPPMKFDIIAAADEKMGIGRSGGLPWMLKNEMAYFNKMTKTNSHPEKKNVVIMGRKTWESIPVKFRPLSGRLNVVLSRTRQDSTDDPRVMECTDLDTAMMCLESDHANIDRIWIVGGAGVYEEAMEHKACNKIYLTEIEGDFDCDVFFPEIPSNFIKLEDHGDEAEAVPMEVQEENNIKYRYRIYQKQA